MSYKSKFNFLSDENFYSDRMMRKRNLRKRFGHFRVTFFFLNNSCGRDQRRAGYGLLFILYGVMVDYFAFVTMEDHVMSFCWHWSYVIDIQINITRVFRRFMGVIVRDGNLNE